MARWWTVTNSDHIYLNWIPDKPYNTQRRPFISTFNLLRTTQLSIAEVITSSPTLIRSQRNVGQTRKTAASNNFSDPRPGNFSPPEIHKSPLFFPPSPSGDKYDTPAPTCVVFKPYIFIWQGHVHNSAISQSFPVRRAVRQSALSAGVSMSVRFSSVPHQTLTNYWHDTANKLSYLSFSCGIESTNISINGHMLLEDNCCRVRLCTSIWNIRTRKMAEVKCQLFVLFLWIAAFKVKRLWIGSSANLLMQT